MGDEYNLHKNSEDSGRQYNLPPSLHNLSSFTEVHGLAVPPKEAAHGCIPSETGL